MIEAKGLTKRFGEREAVADVSFSVEAGEIVGFLGPNGAGKTTTMRMLTGFFPPSSGTGSVAGFDVFHESMKVRECIGYLPETPPVYREMVVTDYLEFAARIRGVTKPDLDERVDQAVERCGLEEVAHRLIGNLSKGYRQRVGLAQALVHHPKVLILDEPTAGLDPRQIREIRELIKGLRGERTIILSTHILPEVAQICERAIVINRGRIVATDTLQNLQSANQASHVVSVQVKGGAEKLLQTLRQLPGVQQVRSLDDPNRLEVDTDPGRDVRDEIARAAVEHGLLELKTVTQSLEDVFVNLTTQEKSS